MANDSTAIINAYHYHAGFLQDARHEVKFASKLGKISKENAAVVNAHLDDLEAKLAPIKAELDNLRKKGYQC